MEYESAAIWNQIHPIGTIVWVHLLGGNRFETKTRSAAQQWGSFAIVLLHREHSMRTVGALYVLSRDVNEISDAHDIESSCLDLPRPWLADQFLYSPVAQEHSRAPLQN